MKVTMPRMPPSSLQYHEEPRMHRGELAEFDAPLGPELSRGVEDLR